MWEAVVLGLEEEGSAIVGLGCGLKSLSLIIRFGGGGGGGGGAALCKRAPKLAEVT